MKSHQKKERPDAESRSAGAGGAPQLWIQKFNGALCSCSRERACGYRVTAAPGSPVLRTSLRCSPRRAAAELSSRHGVREEIRGGSERLARYPQTAGFASNVFARPLVKKRQGLRQSSPTSPGAAVRPGGSQGDRRPILRLIQNGLSDSQFAGLFQKKFTARSSLPTRSTAPRSPDCFSPASSCARCRGYPRWAGAQRNV